MAQRKQLTEKVKINNEESDVNVDQDSERPLPRRKTNVQFMEPDSESQAYGSEESEDDPILKIERQAISKALRKAEGKAMVYENNKAEHRTNYHFFENMPKHLRNEIKDDIISMILQNKGTELTPIPDKWEKQLEQRQNLISLKDVVKKIIEDMRCMQGSEPGNEQTQLSFVSNDDLTSNALTQFIEKPNGYPCVMFWPRQRNFVKVKSMKIMRNNAKFIEVQYEVMEKRGSLGTSEIDQKQNSEIITEQYNLLELHMCSLNHQAGQGIQTDLQASHYLKTKIGSNDPRVGRYNVLKLQQTQLNFERLFVFTNEDSQSQKDGITQGEHNLKLFMNAINLLLEKVCTLAKELQGHLAEIKQIQLAPIIKEINFDQEDPDYENLKEQYSKNLINLDKQFIVQIFDQQLEHLRRADEMNSNEKAAKPALTVDHTSAEQSKIWAKNMEKIENGQDINEVEMALDEKIQQLNDAAQRDELNNFIIRFSNFKTSIPLKIDLTNLNEIKNNQILGITPAKHEEDVNSYIKEHLKAKKSSIYTEKLEDHDHGGHENCNIEIEDRNIDFSLNMQKYWEQFDKNIQQTEKSIKPTDYKLIKMFMIERMIPEYDIICHQQVLAKINQLIYYNKLQKTATRDFLKWVNKQLLPNSNFMKQITTKKEQLLEADKQYKQLENEMKFNQVLEIPNKFSNKQKKIMDFSYSKNSDDSKIEVRDIGIDEEIQESLLLFVRGSPIQHFGQNLGTMSYRQTILNQRHSLENLKRQTQSMSLVQIQKQRKTIKKKLQEKQIQIASLNQDYNILRIKRKVLLDIQKNKHLDNYDTNANNKVGLNPTLKNIEYLENFDKFPLQFSKCDLQTKISIFRKNQKEKLLNQSSAHLITQEQESARRFSFNSQKMKKRLNRVDTILNDSHRNESSRHSDRYTLHTLNDFNDKKVDGNEVNFQEYSSMHGYPITQIYDLLAQQQLELNLKMFNYEGEISYSQNKNVKNRRGGKKTQNLRKNQMYKGSYQKSHSVQNPNKKLKYKNPPVYQQKKYRGLSVEELSYRMKMKDFDFKNNYILADIRGFQVTKKEFKNVELNMDKYLEKILGKYKKSQKNFKKGSKENWDKKTREQLRKKIQKWKNKLLSEKQYLETLQDKVKCIEKLDKHLLSHGLHYPDCPNRHHDHDSDHSNHNDNTIQYTQPEILNKELAQGQEKQNLDDLYNEYLGKMEDKSRNKWLGFLGGGGEESKSETPREATERQSVRSATERQSERLNMTSNSQRKSIRKSERYQENSVQYEKWTKDGETPEGATDAADCQGCDLF